MRQNTLEPGAARAIFSTSTLAVDGEEPHAKLVGARDIALLLDRVAKGDAVRRRSGGQHHLDFGRGGGVEAGAELNEELQDLRRRIGLHRVEHPGVGQRLGEGEIVFADDLEVDDQARAFLAASLEEFADAFSQFFCLLHSSSKPWMTDAEGFARLRFPVAGPSPAAG